MVNHSEDDGGKFSMTGSVDYAVIPSGVGEETDARLGCGDGELGVFRAVTTRDAVALERDGEPYFDCKAVLETQPSGDALYEVQFEDGLWMLARLTDLDF